MNASGIFFLTGRPALVNTRNAAGETRKEWRFPLLERAPQGSKGVELLTGVWLGTEAATFVEQNAPQLKAGMALDIQFSRVRPDGDRLVCRIAECKIAPPRWPERAVAKLLDDLAKDRALGTDRESR